MICQETSIPLDHEHLEAGMLVGRPCKSGALRSPLKVWG